MAAISSIGVGANLELATLLDKLSEADAAVPGADQFEEVRRFGLPPGAAAEDRAMALAVALFVCGSCSMAAPETKRPASLRAGKFG